jgi:hypothetical protein
VRHRELHREPDLRPGLLRRWPRPMCRRRRCGDVRAGMAISRDLPGYERARVRPASVYQPAPSLRRSPGGVRTGIELSLYRAVVRLQRTIVRVRVRAQRELRSRIGSSSVTPVRAQVSAGPQQRDGDAADEFCSPLRAVGPFPRRRWTGRPTAAGRSRTAVAERVSGTHWGQGWRSIRCHPDSHRQRRLRPGRYQYTNIVPCCIPRYTEDRCNM